jgi:hypothetical protein
VDEISAKRCNIRSMLHNYALPLISGIFSVCIVDLVWVIKHVPLFAIGIDSRQRLIEIINEEKEASST